MIATRQLIFKKVPLKFNCPYCPNFPYGFVIYKPLDAGTWKRVKCKKCHTYIKKEEIRRILAEQKLIAVSYNQGVSHEPILRNV